MEGQGINAEDVIKNRISDLNDIINTVWMVIMSVMIILSQIGYMMVEIGTASTVNSSDLHIKNLLVMSVSSIVFFLLGYGFARNAEGGLMGQKNFIGAEYEYSDYAQWIYYYSLCVTMASIATGSIAERTSLDTYLFYTFLTSALIFPLALAWTWENGWLKNLGFVDFAGAGVVHLTGGITGFIGAALQGARTGYFQKDTKYAYILNEENFIEDGELLMKKIEQPDERHNIISSDRQGEKGQANKSDAGEMTFMNQFSLQHYQSILSVLTRIADLYKR